jgi:hypothetical protein
MADAVRSFLPENANQESELSAFVLEAVKDRIFAETVTHSSISKKSWTQWKKR